MGSAPSDRTPWKRYTESQWVAYRDAQIHARARAIDENQSTKVLDACIAMADFYLARLRRAA